MSGGDNFFVDSNLLLYQFSPAEIPKQSAADRWMGHLWSYGSGRISWQVIHEFYANAVKKLRMPALTARLVVEQLMEWEPDEPDIEMIRRAWHWCDSAQLNYWDALIVSAAEQSGSQWLLSEDFQNGREFGAITVVNPFLRQPSEFGLV
jgi:predicted nucleic acid-binding protein